MSEITALYRTKQPQINNNYNMGIKEVIISSTKLSS